MKKSLLIISILFIFANLDTYSQSISKSVIGSCGGTFASEFNKISMTVGEPVVGTMTGGKNQLGNGFLASLDLEALTIAEIVPSKTEVYPNPATNFLVIKNERSSLLQIKITDLNGKVLTDVRITSGDKIDISFLKQGMYVLQSTEINNNSVEIFKIIVNSK